jgi:hypothetical protein
MPSRSETAHPEHEIELAIRKLAIEHFTFAGDTGYLTY